LIYAASFLKIFGSYLFASVEDDVMIHFFRAILGDDEDNLRQKVGGLFALLIAFNIGAWIYAYVAFHHHSLLMGTSLLAYSFGLRHAVDADHIAAIDNVTRKLMQTGKRPVTVGLMFSLGHSTIVVLASAGVAATTLAMRNHLDDIRELGSLVGTLVSIFFLFAIALMNLVILRSVLHAFGRLRRGAPYVEEDFDMLLVDRGFLSRVFRPLFSLISRSWHMYFLGFLFGLGFDTATEIALLGISAAGAAQAMPVWSILVFPVLFTAGMTIIDTADSILMLGAYGWAFVNPIRKLYYNITITAVSVAVAFIVGCIECLGLIAGRFQSSGSFWHAIAGLNGNFSLIGYVIVGVFACSWACSAAVYRWKRFDELGARNNRTE
jgi:high-affinity nickel-transport protein